MSFAPTCTCVAGALQSQKALALELKDDLFYKQYAYFSPCMSLVLLSGF